MAPRLDSRAILGLLGGEDDLDQLDALYAQMVEEPSSSAAAVQAGRRMSREVVIRSGLVITALGERRTLSAPTHYELIVRGPITVRSPKPILDRRSWRVLPIPPALVA